ncbi:hypothetical protein QEH52_18580 [Coraliomargarita sp. SDUM461003]|uniref:Lipoprotein n=1 Tax=Thalassobacterium maritimum TaxID=3041265 RepID=A0ABU1AZJ0_9BACT|nr:hypothetical protein [Coraliomargarita sp. SDUM461003]MDQ8209538.1 hypothetical protein [Coraliomargarita sp. SDUM461003]
MKKLILLLVIISTSCFAAEIKVSELDEAKSERREKAFENWIPIAEMQVQFEALTSEGRFPVYSERDGGKVREIFIDQPTGLTFWAWTGMSEKELLTKHEKYLGEGFVILSLGLLPEEGKVPRYWGIWVNESLERKVMRDLKHLGISQASIEID